MVSGAGLGIRGSRKLNLYLVWTKARLSRLGPWTGKEGCLQPQAVADAQQTKEAERA